MGYKDRMSCNVWPEGNRRDHVIIQLSLSVIALLLATGLGWGLITGVAGVLWGLAIGGVAGLTIVVCARFSDLPHLILDDTRLRRESGRRRTESIRLDSITRIESDWIPYRDSVIVFANRDGFEIRCRTGERTTSFLHAVGLALLPYRHQIHDVSPGTQKALGWAIQ